MLFDYFYCGMIFQPQPDSVNKDALANLTTVADIAAQNEYGWT